MALVAVAVGRGANATGHVKLERRMVCSDCKRGGMTIVLGWASIRERIESIQEAETKERRRQSRAARAARTAEPDPLECRECEGTGKTISGGPLGEDRETCEACGGGGRI